MPASSPFHATDFTLRPLDAADASLIVHLLSSQQPDYLRFFHALATDEAVVTQTLQARLRDVYSGLFWRGRLVCVFMLRGWDAGFDIPAFGLIVDAEHRGREVLTVALEAAKTIGRLRGAVRIMAKVHPDNVAGTRGAHRLGFVPASEEPKTGNIVYYLEL